MATRGRWHHRRRRARRVACSGLTAPGAGGRRGSRRPGGWSRAPGARSPRAPGRRCAASRSRSAGGRGGVRASGPARGRHPSRSRRSRRSRSASSSAASSTRLPRETLIRYALRFIRRKLVAADQVLGRFGRDREADHEVGLREQRGEVGLAERRRRLHVRIAHQDVHAERLAELGEPPADAAVADDAERAAAKAGGPSPPRAGRRRGSCRSPR